MPRHTVVGLRPHQLAEIVKELVVGSQGFEHRCLQARRVEEAAEAEAVHFVDCRHLTRLKSSN